MIEPTDACYNCGQTGHWRRNCPLPPRSAATAATGPRHAASGRHHPPAAINRTALAATVTRHAAANTLANAAATPADYFGGLATVGMAYNVRIPSIITKPLSLAIRFLSLPQFLRRAYWGSKFALPF